MHNSRLDQSAEYRIKKKHIKSLSNAELVAISRQISKDFEVQQSILGFSRDPNDFDKQSLPSTPSYSCMVCKSKTIDKCSLCETSICSPCSFYHVEKDERLCYSYYQIRTIQLKEVSMKDENPIHPIISRTNGDKKNLIHQLQHKKRIPS